MSSEPTRPSTPSPNPAAELRDRFTETAKAWGRRARRHALATYSWSRRQPPKRLATFAAGILAAAVAAWIILQVLMWLVSGLIQLVFGPDTPEPPPQWVVDVQNASLWGTIYRAVTGYAHQHAASVGVPPMTLVGAWAVLGVVLLIGCWWEKRRERALAWLAWLAATTWVIWTGTPGGSPVPAALAAILGLGLASTPGTVLLASLLYVPLLLLT